MRQAPQEMLIRPLLVMAVEEVGQEALPPQQVERAVPLVGAVAVVEGPAEHLAQAVPEVEERFEYGSGNIIS